MSDVARLPVSGKPRTHVTLPVDELGAQLAEAQTTGFLHALDMLECWGLARHEIVAQYEEFRDLRAKLYAAQLRLPKAAES